MRLSSCFRIFSRKTCLNTFRKEGEMAVFFIPTNYDHVHNHNFEYKKDHFSSFLNVFTHVFRLKVLKHELKRIEKEAFERFSLTLGNRNCERNMFTFSGFSPFSMRLNAFLKNCVCFGILWDFISNFCCSISEPLVEYFEVLIFFRSRLV